MRLLLDTHSWIWSLLESRRNPLPHADPADRFLAAAARVYDLALVTADERLLGHGGSFAAIANA